MSTWAKTQFCTLDSGPNVLVASKSSPLSYGAREGVSRGTGRSRGGERTRDVDAAVCYLSKCYHAPSNRSYPPAFSHLWPRVLQRPIMNLAASAWQDVSTVSPDPVNHTA